MSTFIYCKINGTVQILLALFPKNLILLWSALIVVPQIMNDFRIFSIQSQPYTLIDDCFSTIMTTVDFNLLRIRVVRVVHARAYNRACIDFKFTTRE